MEKKIVKQERLWFLGCVEMWLHTWNDGSKTHTMSIQNEDGTVGQLNVYFGFAGREGCLYTGSVNVARLLIKDKPPASES